MDIEEIREEKAKLESSIKELILAFEKKTDLYIDKLKISHAPNDNLNFNFDIDIDAK